MRRFAVLAAWAGLTVLQAGVAVAYFERGTWWHWLLHQLVGWGLGLERSTQLGSAVATAAVEVVGTQEYDLPRRSFLRRFADAFGHTAADEIAPHLPG